MIIAQISDINAAADNDNLSRVDRALAWLDIIAPDVLVLTGDLIDNGEIEGKRRWNHTVIGGMI